MEKQVYIFDTTLRDGEQAPGASLNTEEKLRIAQQLAKLNVDVIEAGFPISSPGDFEAVQTIAREVQGPVICGLARARTADIDRAWEALKEAKYPRIHIFIATSDIHLEHKLRKSREEVLQMAVEAVKYAKQYTSDVEFSAEDASRSDLGYLCEIVEATIDAGATVINIPDTVGYAVPEEFGEFIKGIRQGVKNIDQATLSVHCHNDLGLAVANSLTAVSAGANQVEVAVNGLGERAGNAALEEIVMALYVKNNYFNAGTAIKHDELYRTSRMVSSLTGIQVQPNKAIVGKNAFLHESGIHQDGVLKERTTYEIMNPDLIGVPQENIVLGKHSGRHALKERLSELGYMLADDGLDMAFARFKEIADRKKVISDLDLDALVKNEIRISGDLYQLSYMHIFSGTNIVPTATIGLKRNGNKYEEAACGDGPVDAAFKALDKALGGLHVDLVDYNLNAITGGKDALGEVMVRVQAKDKNFVGRGVSTDVIEASVKAYLNALNKVLDEVGEDAL